MSNQSLSGEPALTPEEIDRKQRELLAKAVRIILSWPEPEKNIPLTAESPESTSSGSPDSPGSSPIEAGSK